MTFPSIPSDEWDARARHARRHFLDELERDYGVPRYAHASDRHTSFPALPGGRVALKQVLVSRKVFFSWLIPIGRVALYRKLVSQLGGEAGMIRSRWAAKRRAWLSAGCPQNLPPWKVITPEEECA